MDNFSITAVVVTYNRLPLLKECLEGILGQSRAVNSVVVVDNASTDGTRLHLDEIQLRDQRVKPCFLRTNIGGAGGFAKGIEIALNEAPDFVWIMDDDTIPETTALELLVQATEAGENALGHHIGFALSNVRWTDGNPHIMNAAVNAPFNSRSIKPDIDLQDLSWVDRCSFVSVLIRGDAIREVGLPYQEYFIWGDDAEYTLRITRSGYPGVYVSKSIVTHKTRVNKGVSIRTDIPQNAWRYFYNTRNILHLTRVYRVSWLGCLLASMNFLARQIAGATLRPNYRMRFLLNVAKGFIAALRFHPARVHRGQGVFLRNVRE